VPAALLAVELLVCEFRVRFVMKGGQVVRRNAPDVRMREVCSNVSFSRLRAEHW
jgi:hypothetical protein